MTDPGAPPLNLKELEARLRAEAGIFAVDSEPPGVLSLSEEWALLRALRETRAVLHQIFEEASGFADWAHARRIKLLARDVLGRVDD